VALTHLRQYFQLKLSCKRFLIAVDVPFLIQLKVKLRCFRDQWLTDAFS
jgi:hypothetical protein